MVTTEILTEMIMTTNTGDYDYKHSEEFFQGLFKCFKVYFSILSRFYFCVNMLILVLILIYQHVHFE